MGAAPSRKVTVPSGVTHPPPEMTTLAVNVTLLPSTAVLPALDVTATAVASLTPWVSVLLLERKLADFALVNHNRVRADCQRRRGRITRHRRVIARRTHID